MMQKLRRCWAEVDLDALRDNLAWIRHRVGNGILVMTVVKADAYGHGLKQIAAHLMRSGTNVFAVANLAEAEAIRSVGQGWPILMLGACLPEEVDQAVADRVMPTVSSLEEARRFSEAGQRHGCPVPVHVKVDTGMGRLGVALGNAEEMVVAAVDLPHVEVVGLYTHYAAVEDDPEFSATQRKGFDGLVRRLRERGIPIAMVHVNNSGAMLQEPESLHNLVRPGLMVYGVLPPGRRPVNEALGHQVRAALSFKCRVSYVKEIPAGATLSYGRSFTAKHTTRVATLSAGYGDGYPRAGSNRAEVLIRGQRCAVVGKITMDQMLADVTHLECVEPGDEVAMIGRQGDEEIDANEVAVWCDTIPWEILTSISYRVPRVYRGGCAA